MNTFTPQEKRDVDLNSEEKKEQVTEVREVMERETVKERKNRGWRVKCSDERREERSFFIMTA